MSRDLVDCHNFSVWRYSDESVDVTCDRPGYDVDQRIAYLEASVLARTLAEEIHENQEIFSIRVFEDGLSTCQFRDEPGFMSGWRRYKWVKRRLAEASHSGLFAVPKCPDAILLTLWGVEYFFCRVRGFFSQQEIEEEVLEPAAVAYPENVIPIHSRKRP